MCTYSSMRRRICTLAYTLCSSMYIRLRMLLDVRIACIRLVLLGPAAATMQLRGTYCIAGMPAGMQQVFPAAAGPSSIRT